MIVEFKYIRREQNHLVVEDEMGTEHFIPQFYHEDVNDVSTNDIIEIDLPLPFIEANGIFY